MTNGKWVLLVLLILFAAQVFAMDPKIENILSKVRENQRKVQDMSAQIVTIIKSNLKDGKSMEQKSSIMIKGEDKSRTETTSPVNQVTITNGDKMAIINSETGQKFVQDLKKLRKQAGKEDFGQNTIDQTKILDRFDLSLEERGLIQKSYVITGTPKEKSQFLGKMKFYLDAEKFVPTKIEIYNPQGKLSSSSDIEYVKIKDIWVAARNASWINVPGGKMEVVMKFEDIKINEGIPDREFEIR